MLQTIEARNSAGALLTIPLLDVSDGIVVEDVEGLDPVDAVLVSTGYAHLDGEQEQAARRDARHMTLKFELRPDLMEESVSELRRRLYRFFMTKSKVSLRFIMSGHPTVDISGTVESHSNARFTEDPKAAIAITCFKPDFLELTPEVLVGNTTESLTETLVDYTGSVETGVLFTLEVDRTISEFTIYHQRPDGTLHTLDFSAPMLAGDVLRISTVPGSKYATLTRSGAVSSILYGISPQSSWISLYPGDNHLRVYAVGAGINYTIEYTTRHGGI